VKSPVLSSRSLRSKSTAATGKYVLELATHFPRNDDAPGNEGDEELLETSKLLAEICSCDREVYYEPFAFSEMRRRFAD